MYVTIIRTCKETKKKKDAIKRELIVLFLFLYQIFRMSLIQSGFLQVPLKNTIEIYNNVVVPRLTKKNKVIGITAAIFMSLVLIIRDRVFKPPRNLRHIPYFGYYGLIKSIASGESLYDRSMRVHVPLVNSSRDGLYVVCTSL